MKTPFATVPPSGYLVSGSRLAACAAAWCSVHCALTPLLVAVAPALALSEGVERGFLVGTVVLGAAMLLLGPAGRNAAVRLVFAGGAAFWAASLAGWLEPLPETATSTAGSLVLAGALLRGARICQADASECAVCDEDEPANPRG
ncbi:MAG: MerC domain-containing protein [Gemmatimonadetes bacterium]|nr:MerC domain-containing protein [Candidatus Palauibacter rhopaloidicola]